MTYDPSSPDYKDREDPQTEYCCEGCEGTYDREVFRVLRGRKLCPQCYVGEAQVIVAETLDEAFHMTPDALREVGHLRAEIEQINEDIDLSIRLRWAQIEREQRDLLRKAVA